MTLTTEADCCLTEESLFAEGFPLFLTFISHVAHARKDEERGETRPRAEVGEVFK